MLEINIYKTNQHYALWKHGEPGKGTAHNQEELERICNDLKIDFENTTGIYSVDESEQRVTCCVKTPNGIISSSSSTPKGIRFNRVERIIDEIFFYNEQPEDAIYHINYDGNKYEKFLDGFKSSIGSYELKKHQNIEEGKDKLIFQPIPE